MSLLQPKRLGRGEKYRAKTDLVGRKKATQRKRGRTPDFFSSLFSRRHLSPTAAFTRRGVPMRGLKSVLSRDS